MNSSFIVKAQSVKSESTRETEARPSLFFNDSLTKPRPEMKAQLPKAFLPGVPCRTRKPTKNVDNLYI